MTAWVAAALLATAAALLIPASPRRGVAPSSGVASSGVASSGARQVPSWLVRRGRRARDAADRAAVLQTCELLAADLAAGRPAPAALEAAAERWPALAPVAEAQRWGADVPTAMRRLATERSGAADLVWVAAAWQVSHHTGVGLAAALERTAGGLRATRRTRRLVDSELASARATSRLVAVLPLAVLLMGSGAGSDPWSFLLFTPVGWLCAALGLSLTVLGLWWIEHLADRAVAA